MSKPRLHLMLSLIACAAVIAAAPRAHAQATGELVDPNIVILVDSSGSMNWVMGTSTTNAQAAAREADAACRNQEADKRTSWQRALDVLLGEIPDTEYHCAVEGPNMRPNLGPLLSLVPAADVTAWKEKFPQAVSEFREDPYNFHRAVACPAGFWNSTYLQCIDETDPTANTICEVGDTQYPDRVLCRIADCDTTRRICWNLHPAAVARQSNGILDRYYNKARMSLFVYDTKPTPAMEYFTPMTDPHEGYWNYGPSRRWQCRHWDDTSPVGTKTCTWNAGARGAYTLSATSTTRYDIGGYVASSDLMAEADTRIRATLETVEPLYCSPPGSLLDDVGHYWASEPSVLPAYNPDARFRGTDRYYSCRPKLVIFITDGQPTSGFEFPEEYCETDASDPAITPKDPVATIADGAPAAADKPYKCPWHSSLAEAAELYNMANKAELDPEADPIRLVVIGFNVPAGRDATDIDCSNTMTQDDATRPPECIRVRYTESFASSCDPTVSGRNYLSPREFLNAMACRGWPSTSDVDHPADGICAGDPDFCSPGDRAFFVESMAEMSAVLDAVISAETSNVATRTDVVFSDVVPPAANPNEFIGQFEFNTGYIPRQAAPWQGVLYRKDFVCGTTTTATPRFNYTEFGSKLVSQTTRKLLTAPAIQLSDYLSVNTQLGGVKKSIALNDATLNDCAFGGPTTGCASTVLIRDAVTSYMADRGLADIYNSTPAVLGPPAERLDEPDYLAFKTSVNLPGTTKLMSERPPYLFVGTNDGVVHAFDIFAADVSGKDVEVWSYVPGLLLRSLKDQFPLKVNVSAGVVTSVEETGAIPQHLFGVDGAPVVQDVRLYRRAAELGAANRWRSILLGGLGKGGRGYYALDVTNPADPTSEPWVRWEISPVSQANNPAGSFDSNCLDDRDELNDIDGTTPEHGCLGLSVGKPAIAYVYANQNDLGVGASKYEMAVGILPGGIATDSSGTPQGSTGVSIVRLADGKLLRYLKPGAPALKVGAGGTWVDNPDICGTPSDVENGLLPTETAQLIGEPALPYGSKSLKVTTEAFMGDDQGRLWMVDMSSANPRDWCLKLYFDTLVKAHYPADGSIPLLNAPTIAEDEDRNTVMIFGTGHLDGLVNLNHNRIFSLTDTGWARDASGAIIRQFGKPVRAKPKLNWWIGAPVPTTAVVDASRQWIQDAMLGDATFKTHVDFGTPVDGMPFFSVGEKLIGRPVVFNDTAFFTTFVAASSGMADACGGGGARLWAVHYKTRVGFNTLFESAFDDNDFGRWLADDTCTTDCKYRMFKWYPGEFQSGARIVRRPPCDGNEPTFELVTQRVNPAYNPASATNPDTTPAIQSVVHPMRPSMLPITTVRFDSWSLVFE